MAANKSPMRGSGPKESQTGAEYEVLKTSLINGKIVNAGEIVTYDGNPGQYLKPVNAAAKSIKSEVDKIKADRADTVIKTETLSGTAEADRKLKELSDKRLGVGTAAEPKDSDEPAANQKELLAQAEKTYEDNLKASQQSGGVLVQMTGVAPETVIPTTGAGAEANAQQQKSAAEQKKGR